MPAAKVLFRLVTVLAFCWAPPLLAAAAADEGQAKSQMEAAGYADVSRLHEANQGEWMADATKDGHPVKITLRPDGSVALREKVDVPAPAPPPPPVTAPGAPSGGAAPAAPGTAQP